MTNTEAIEWLSKMPKDTPLIIEWWTQDEFYEGDDNINDELWSDVCEVADRKLSTDGWNEDIMYLIDEVKEK